MSKGKIIVVSAPSGCGKSTIINRIISEGINLTFSVSATNRQPREGEKNGCHYHFMTTEEIRSMIQNDGFIEWEEVYPGRFYGTLKSEVENKINDGRNVVLDIDVKGALNVKKIYGDQALLIFIEPPSIDVLRKRLEHRGTDDEQTINVRISKAEYEISFAKYFDYIVINDNLDKSVKDVSKLITNFLEDGK